jgi:hypothetical protein
MEDELVSGLVSLVGKVSIDWINFPARWRGRALTLGGVS